MIHVIVQRVRIHIMYRRKIKDSFDIIQNVKFMYLLKIDKIEYMQRKLHAFNSLNISICIKRS